MGSATQFSRAENSALYSQYRPPEYPKAVYDEIWRMLGTQTRQLAVDVACGTGISARALGTHFQQVLGIDQSENQIKQAKKDTTATNVKFEVSDCCRIPVKDHSVNLITAAMCVHWFKDMDAFYREVKRCLVPGGVLAIYGHLSIEIIVTDEVSLKKKTINIEKEELPDDRFHPENIKLPLKDVCVKHDLRTPQCERTLGHVLGEVRTWSGVHRYKENTGQDQVAGFERKYESQLEEIHEQQEELR